MVCTNTGHGEARKSSYPGRPPLSMWLARVTSSLHTSNCHFRRPRTPHSTLPVWIPILMSTLKPVASRTNLRASIRKSRMSPSRSFRCPRAYARGVCHIALRIPVRGSLASCIRDHTATVYLSMEKFYPQILVKINCGLVVSRVESPWSIRDTRIAFISCLQLCSCGKLRRHMYTVGITWLYVKPNV